jgi:hypothetical protein
MRRTKPTATLSSKLHPTLSFSLTSPKLLAKFSYLSLMLTLAFQPFTLEQIPLGLGMLTFETKTFLRSFVL